jgi:hypothetical protein
MPPLEEVDDVCVKYLIEGETFMVRRLLNMYVNMDDLKG